MGPNSGGGKRNKSKATPARARFSSFRLEHKSKSSGKDSEGREQKKRAVKNGISASVAGAADQVSQSLLAAADLFQMSVQVAEHVISLLSRHDDLDNSECSSSTSSPDDDSVDAAAAAPVDTIEKATEAIRLDRSMNPVLHSPHRGLSDSEICALQLFSATFGFTRNDFVDISDVVGNDFIDICAGAVMRSCGIEVTCFDTHTPSSTLEEELGIMASIFGEKFCAQRSSSGCVLAQLTSEVSGSSAIFAIQKSDLYPSNYCHVAAWLNSPLLSRSKSVAFCQDALRRVEERCAQGSPIMFDLFQILEEASLTPQSAETESQSQREQIYDKYHFVLDLKNPTEPNTQKEEQPSVHSFEDPSAHMKQLQVTTSSSGHECVTECDRSMSVPSDQVQSVRMQYNKALNWADESGFSPSEASQKAKERLCGMFPQFAEASILACLNGKSVNLDKPSIAFKIQQLDFGVQLQCTKAIMKSTDVTKGKAKSLMALAQQQIIEDGGNIFASDIDEAKQLWVDLSVSIFEEQNLARRKQQAASYQARHSVTTNISEAAVVSSSAQAHNIPTSEGGTKLGSSKASSQTAEDLKLPHVSKLFSEQQCVDAVSAHSTRMRQKILSPEKTESEIKSDQQLSERLCQELQVKVHSHRYKRMLATREKLPAFQQQAKITSDILKNKVTLVIGDTGWL